MTKKISLRYILIFLFVVQILIAVGLTGFLSFHAGQKSVNELATQLSSEITSRIEERIHNYMETPYRINEFNANAIELGQLNWEDKKSISQHLYKQLKSFPNLSSAHFTTITGEHFACKRMLNNSLSLVKRNPVTGGLTTRYLLNQQGNPIELLEMWPNYNPQRTIWYQTALKSGKPTWSDIHTDFINKMPTITAAKPIYDKDENFIGVLGSDVFFPFLNQFLSNLKIGRNGQTFILDRKNFLITASTNEQVFTLKANQTGRINATESENLAIQTSTKYLLEEFKDLEYIDKNYEYIFKVDGKRHFLEVAPLKDERGLDWLIVVLIPESDFMVQIEDNLHNTIMLSVAALMVAITIAVLISQWIANPILKLNLAAQEVARGDLSHRLSAGKFKEIEELSTSFNTMMGRLKTVFETLEEKVRERTWELREKNEILEDQKEELVAQREEIQAQRDNLSEINSQLGISLNNMTVLGEIGQKITSTLDLNQILWTVYEHVNALMDATSFGIGIFDEENQTIEYKLCIEKGVRLPTHSSPIDDPRSLAAWCIKNRKEIFINDFSLEYSEYVSQIPTTRAGEDTESLIYLPLKVEERTVGVITAQSFKKKAYTNYHLDILKTIASYTSIALDNSYAYTKLNKALKELKETQAQLVHSEKMSSLGQLTAGIAHEINNPVNFISSGLPSLKRDIDKLFKYISDDQKDGKFENINARIGKLLSSIENGVKRTTEIVKSLRTFSRLDEAAFKDADIHEAIDSTLTLLHNQIKRRIHIEKNYGNIPLVECFVSQINQVLMNILVNAIHAIEDSGTITITTSQPDADHIQISIKDTGKGIPQTIQTQIFDPFYTTKEVGKGTGLGLSITHGIIEKHHGKIKVISQEGFGAEFIITLPIKS